MSNCGPILHYLLCNRLAVVLAPKYSPRMESPSSASRRDTYCQASRPHHCVCRGTEVFVGDQSQVRVLTMCRHRLSALVAPISIASQEQSHIGTNAASTIQHQSRPHSVVRSSVTSTGSSLIEGLKVQGVSNCSNRMIRFSKSLS